MDTLTTLLTLLVCMTLLFSSIYLRLARLKLKRMRNDSEAASEPLVNWHAGGEAITKMNRRDFQLIEDAGKDPLFIYSPIALLNTVCVKTTVQAGGALILYGTSIDDMTINVGGKAILYGTLIGKLVNEGGELHIYGRVIGTVHDNAGVTKIYNTAQILRDE